MFSLNVQATLLPLLVDTRRVSPKSSDLLRKMVFMTPPQSRQKLAFSPAGKDDGIFYAPSQAANFRSNLLRTVSGFAGCFATVCRFVTDYCAYM